MPPDDQVYPNCLSCAIGPLLRLSSLMGYPCVIIKCRHRETTYADGFRYSKFYFFTSFLITSSLLTSSAWYLYRIIVARDSGGFDSLHFVKLLNNFFFCLRSAIPVIVISSQASTGKCFFESIESSMSYWKSSKSELLLNEKSSRRLRTNSILFSFIIMKFWTLYFVYLLLFDYNADWHFLPKLSSLVCFYVDTMIVFLVTVILQLHLILLQTYQKTVEISLREKLMEEGTGGRNCLSETLLVARRLHTKIIWSLAYYNKLNNPSVVLWLLIAVTMIITNNYVVLSAWIDNLNVFGREIVLSNLQLYVSLLVITYSIYRYEVVSRSSEDILSFLFKYPISKLSVAEATQVEMLIKTLKLQKPKLRASDVFTIGTRLLASISGIVVTYVLVALQFHASWTSQSTTEETKPIATDLRIESFE